MTFGNFFNVLILMGISVPIVLAYFFIRDRKNENTWARKHFVLSGTLIFCLLLGAAIIIYGSFIESQRIKITHYDLDIQAELSTPIVIALYGDFQVGPYKRTNFVQRVVNTINNEHPDIVLGVGDFVMNDGSQSEDETQFLTPLKEIAAPHFVVSGNHEHGLGNPTWTARTGNVQDLFYARMKDIAPVLDNTHAEITLNGQTISIYGLDDLWSRKMDLQGFADTVVNDNNPAILMAHNPDTILQWIDFANTAGIDPSIVDLVVSGHTHGGQIALPFIGPIGNPDVTIPKKYFRGVSYWDAIPLLVTSGVGESGPRARLGVPPEVVIVTVQ